MAVFGKSIGGLVVTAGIIGVKVAIATGLFRATSPDVKIGIGSCLNTPSGSSTQTFELKPVPCVPSTDPGREVVKVQYRSNTNGTDCVPYALKEAGSGRVWCVTIVS